VGVCGGEKGGMRRATSETLKEAWRLRKAWGTRKERRARAQATIPMPKCDKCRHNRAVKYVCPDTCGASFHCTKCKSSWAQSW
jgi:transposase-like protein